MNQEAELSDAAPPPKKGKFIKILILAALTILLVVAGGLAYLILTDDPNASVASSQAASASHSEKAIMPLEPFLVNLADRDNRRYLKLKVDLEVGQEKSIKELENPLSPIRDALILLLSSKGYADISTVAGKRQLKQDIMQILATISGDRQISNIYFTEFVSQ